MSQGGLKILHSGLEAGGRLRSQRGSALVQ